MPGIIKLDFREKLIRDAINHYNKSLGLLAEVKDKETLIVGDAWFIPSKPGIVLISERKKIGSDFFSSLYSGLSKDQIKRLIKFAEEMMEKGKDVRIIYQISGNEQHLTHSQKMALSTYKANLSFYGITPYSLPNDDLLAHNFIRVCMAREGLLKPNFEILCDPVNKYDSRFVKQLKQFDAPSSKPGKKIGLGEVQSVKLGEEFSNHLELLGIDPKSLISGQRYATESLNDAINRRAMEISKILRKDKNLKDKPKKPLEIIVKLLKWELGVEDDK